MVWFFFSDIDGIRRVLSSFYTSLFSAEDLDVATQDFLLRFLVGEIKTIWHPSPIEDVLHSNRKAVKFCCRVKVPW